MKKVQFSRIRTLFVGAIAVTLVACGSSTLEGGVPAPEASSADVSKDGAPIFVRTGGTFGAFPLKVVDGAAFVTPSRDGARGAKSELRIVMGDRPGLCGTGPQRKDETILTIDALSVEATFRPGTFTQTDESNPGQVDVSVTKMNATCGTDGQDYGAAKATVTVASVTDAAVSGTFEVTLKGGAGTLTGTFDVPVCAKTIDTACLP